MLDLDLNTRFFVEPCTAGFTLHSSGTAVADGGLAALDDGRHLTHATVDLKHLFDFGRVALHIVVGDWSLLLERLQRIRGVGSARLAVYDDLAHI